MFFHDSRSGISTGVSSPRCLENWIKVRDGGGHVLQKEVPFKELLPEPLDSQSCPDIDIIYGTTGTVHLTNAQLWVPHQEPSYI